VNSALSKAREKGVARFLPNPEECWGPKPRAGRRISSKHIPSHGDLIVNGTPLSTKSNNGDNASMECDKENDKERESNAQSGLHADDTEREALTGEEGAAKRQKVDTVVG
jgi:tRNA (guanine26-N2/guanine27-N2)-dimethyltransferase